MGKGGPGNNQEKAPKSTEIVKRLPVNRKKKKCLGCTDGKIYNGKIVRDCNGCNGTGFLD